MPSQEQQINEIIQIWKQTAKNMENTAKTFDAIAKDARPKSFWSWLFGE